MTILSPSSFNQEEYNKLKLILGIKNKMLQLTAENVNQTGDEFISNKDIIGSKEGILVLCRCFIDLASFYPKKMTFLINLFIYLLEKKSDSNYLDFLPTYIVKCIHYRERLRSSALLFLRKLFLENAITYNLIIKEINNLPPNLKDSEKLPLDDDVNHDYIKYTEKGEAIFENENMEGQLIEKLSPYSCANRKKLKVILWFYPEIKQRYKKFLIEHVVHVPDDEYELSYKPNRFIENINNGFCPDPMARMIRKDDVDAFTLSCSQFESPKDFDATFKKTASFDRYIILLHQPTFIQYAAFFNAVKIFKYLLLNKADTKAVNNKTYSLAHFAVAGGSIEIIRILAQNHFEMVSAIPIAIENYQNEIFEYLLDNYFPKSIEEYDAMDYNHQLKQEEEELKPEFKFDFENYSDFDNFYQTEHPYLITIPKDDEDNNDEADVEKSDDEYKFFNFDVVFHSIVESNNFLALFILYNRQVSINVQDLKTKRTLLHIAVQKGKTFLVQLLLSNKYINPILRDKNNESPIVYSVKYGKEDLFFEMIKNEKILNSLDYLEYIKIAQYSMVCNLTNVKNYLMKEWKFNLIELMDLYDVKTFANIVYAAPFYFFKDQYSGAVQKAFLDQKFHFLAMLLNRNDCARIKFYFKETKMEKNTSSADAYGLLTYYSYNPHGKSFYQLYKEDPAPYKTYFLLEQFGFNPDGHEPDYDFESYSYMFYPIHLPKQKPYVNIQYY